MSLPNEREIIKQTTINASQAASGIVTIPFSNVPAGPGYTFVTEIIRIFYYNGTTTAGTSDVGVLYRGQFDERSSGTFDPGVLCVGGTVTFGAAQTTTPVFQQFDFHDGNGNGLIVPENALTSVTPNSESIGWHIFYKMRKMRNEDLLVLMVNQGSARV